MPVPGTINRPSSCDASKGHGDCLEWLHVPSVSSPNICFELYSSDNICSTVGGAVGIAVGEAIIASILPQKLSSIPNFASLGLGTTVAALNDSVGRIHLIPVRVCVSFSRVDANLRKSNQDVALRNAVLHAWSEAIGTIWIMSTPISGFALILSLFLREYSLDRRTVRDGEAKTPGDLERGAGAPKPADDDPDMTPTNSVIHPEEPETDKEKGEA